MKKFIIILVILGLATIAIASYRVGGGTGSILTKNWLILTQPKPNSSVDYSGTYWGTAYGAMWTEAYTIDSRWAETYNTEI